MCEEGRREPPFSLEGFSITERGKGKGKTTGQKTCQESSRKVERWFYNCGEHDFTYVLTFAGGVLEKEETEGYGKGRSDC
jgi:hypothetical protein